MEKHIIDEKTGIPYTLVGDYYLPWGDLPDDEAEQLSIGIWGQRHLWYIKQQQKAFYTQLLTSGKLNGYLADIDRQADELFSRLVTQLVEKQGITVPSSILRKLVCSLGKTESSSYEIRLIRADCI